MDESRFGATTLCIIIKIQNRASVLAHPVDHIFGTCSIEKRKDDKEKVEELMFNKDYHFSSSLISLSRD